MPRMNTYREPKPPPHRSRSHQRSQSQSENSSPLPRNESNYDVPAPEPKKHLSSLEGHIVAASGEFVGTFMFLYFAFAGQLMIINQASDRSILNGAASSQQNIFVALVYGFSLLVNVWAFFRISGGLFNPAVCILPVSSRIRVGRSNDTKIHPGNRWHGSCRSTPLHTIPLSRSRSATRMHVRGWSRPSYVSWRH